MAEMLIDGLNRSAKLFIDRSAVSTVEEAVGKLRGFRMHLFIGEAAAASATHQAALLTALNCGRRTFLGGVTVSGALDAPLAVAATQDVTLAEAVRRLQGEVVDAIAEGAPLVSIGAPPAIDPPDFAIRTTFDGWRGGVTLFGAPPLSEAVEFAPSGVLAGALAVSEVFAHFDGEAMAGYRTIGLSLWDQAAAADWRSPASDGAAPALLPADFWIIGLGHLGQAFLWTIGLLPFAAPSDVRVFLQDIDVAGKSTESTSVLTGAADEGRLKTRICADWAEARGFSTRLVERRFATDMRVANDEPLLALCGVDNSQARAILEGAGFATIFEAGLGSGSEDFRLIRTHSFPATTTASQIWAEDVKDEGQLDQDGATAVPDRPPAYVDLHDRGELDECGLTRLAEVAVGAPFVGMVASAMLISQVVRMVVDGARFSVVNADLRALEHRSLVPMATREIVVFSTSPSK